MGSAYNDFKTDIDVMKCLDIKKSKEQMKCTIVWNRPSLPEVVPLWSLESDTLKYASAVHQVSLFHHKAHTVCGILYVPDNIGHTVWPIQEFVLSGYFD